MVNSIPRVTRERRLLDPLLAARLREARQTAGLSLGDVEDLTGLSRGYLSMLERGQRCHKTLTLLRLHNAIEMPFDLFDELLAAAVDAGGDARTQDR